MATAAVIVPGRSTRWRRPAHAFGLDASSGQARGLAAWWPLVGANGVEMVAKRQAVVANGATVAASSVFGAAPWLDGTNDYVNTGSASLFNFASSDYTLSLWVCPHTLSSSVRNQLWSKDSNAAGGRSFTLEHNHAATESSYTAIGHATFSTDSQYFAYYTPTGLLSAFATTLITVGIRSGVMFIAANGVEQSLTAYPGAGPYVPLQSSSTEAWIGRRVYSGYEEPFHGIVADARVYNRALTPTEIWALYDPATRWDLYWQPGRTLYFDVGAAPVGQPTVKRHAGIPHMRRGGPTFGQGWHT